MLSFCHVAAAAAAQTLFRYYSMCGQYSRALKLFIQCGDREINSAIDVVGKSQNEGLTHQLIDFLVGDKDGVPKDPNYIYRLYMALKKYEDAAKTALIIAKQEQDMGNYPLAHSVVVETTRSLEDAGIKVPLQLRQIFVLLHSYMLVKNLVKRGNHLGAARLLLRVAQSASKFPLHIVPILTSTVIECQRAGLKSSAYEYASMLVRPEYRASLDPNLKKKIEAIVRRRSAQNEELPPETSQCPVSKEPIPSSQLECPTTRDALPMCVVTGNHIVLDDMCFCPNSKYPVTFSAYVAYIDEELQASRAALAQEGSKTGEPVALDPVLGKPVSMSDLKLASPEEVTKYIQRYNNVFEEKQGEKAGEGDGGAASPGKSPSVKEPKVRVRSTKSRRKR
jgi:WD repeat-containing protein 19